MEHAGGRTFASTSALANAMIPFVSVVWRERIFAPFSQSIGVVPSWNIRWTDGSAQGTMLPGPTLACGGTVPGGSFSTLLSE